MVSLLFWFRRLPGLADASIDRRRSDVKPPQQLKRKLRFANSPFATRNSPLAPRPLRALDPLVPLSLHHFPSSAFRHPPIVNPKSKIENRLRLSKYLSVYV
jgi:hypothetical protein